MSRRGTNLDQAIENALRRATWRDGATLVQYDDGSFDAIPPVYLTEVMWIGYKHVRRDLGNIRDWVLGAGMYFPLAENEVKWLKQRVHEECSEECAELRSTAREPQAPPIRVPLRR